MAIKLRTLTDEEKATLENPSPKGLAAGKARSHILEEETDVEVIKKGVFRRKTEYLL